MHLSPVAWVAGVGIASLSCLTTRAAAAQTPDSPHDEIVAEIARLDSIWLNAYVGGDVEAVRPILSDDFLGQIDSVLMDKASLLARLAGSTTVETHLERLTVNVYGDIAVAHAIRRNVVKTEDGLAETRFAYTDVYSYRAGRWVCFTGQSASLDPGA